MAHPSRASALSSRVWRWARRRRRLIAAVLAGVGVLIAMSALLPHQPQPVAVLVAARDLQPGEAITSDAVDAVELAESAVPPGAVMQSEWLIGRIVIGPVAAGEVLTETRVLTGRSVGAGRVGVPIRVADEQVAALLAPGDVVDVVAVVEGVGRRVASAARVVTVPRRLTGFGPGSGSSAGAIIVVAVPPDSALTLASVTTPAGIILRSGSMGEDPPAATGSG